MRFPIPHSVSIVENMLATLPPPLRLPLQHRSGLPRTVQALTLLELLVVLAILSLLVALLFPAFGKMRSTGLKTQSANNLRQLAMATRLYAGEHNNYPPYGQASGNVVWQMLLAPYLNYLPPGAPPDADPTSPILWRTLHGKRPEGVWRNPAASGLIRGGNYSDYGINYRLSGHYVQNGRYSFQNLVEPSTVFLFAEVGNCDRGIRDGWAVISALHDANSTAMAVYADGRVGPLSAEEVEEVTTKKGANDSPWGWVGRADQAPQKN